MSMIRKVPGRIQDAESDGGRTVLSFKTNHEAAALECPEVVVSEETTTKADSQATTEE